MRVDDYATVVQEQLANEGWLIESANRYELTTMAGTMPSGKTFTLRMEGVSCSLTIAGRTKTLTRLPDAWVPAVATLQTIRDLVAAFPANQR